MTAIYIANFGRENYAWPTCLARNTVATMNAAAAQPFWVSGDREGYVQWCMTNAKTATGHQPTRPVASRWFNLMSVIAETTDDIWIHREKHQLWWTRSKPETATIELDMSPSNGQQVYICHKPCHPWSNFDLRGRRLDWNTLHPKAQEFLFTEGTLQKLSDENAAYAQTLLDGDSLDGWHSRPMWQEKVTSRKRNPGTIFNSRQKSIAIMAMNAFGAASSASGQQVVRTLKNKEVLFTRPELERYIADLIADQEGQCALTGMPLQFYGDESDAEMLCSLDRIDSSRHYEQGNLQIVCRFANRWKSSSDDQTFRRLISTVRNSTV